MIDFNDFAKIEIKVGTVISVEKLANSQKLYRLEVDLGENRPRQVIAGLQSYYQPDELINRQFVFVTNLQPRPIMGLQSQAMILAADDTKDKVALLQPIKQIKNGSQVR